MPEFRSNSPESTEAIAAEWGGSLKPGTVVLLSGDLGAGKTCFSRGFLRGRCGNPDDVSSPSFALVNEYQTPDATIYHWDLYRLEPDIDWSALDLEDHLADAAAFTLIEWPEKHPDLNPDACTRVHIEALDETQRKIRIH
ncbi:MAG: tRNA (adenosine(37)-N6)-threonylcarbamoyltransferase complex ATPase subunit type 1 TsaE [Verrucomicrobiota bacterium]